jgi:hypothetical protein
MHRWLQQKNSMEENTLETTIKTDHCKINVKKLVNEDIHRIQMEQDRIQLQGLVNTVMNLQLS